MTTPNETPPVSGAPPSAEPTHSANASGAATHSEAPMEPGPGAPSQAASRPAPLDETVAGRGAADAQAIHTQDTVVSPRLRQLATTPVQPLRPPAGMPPRTPVRNQPVARTPPESSTRLYMLVGVVAVLVLLALILVAVILARSGPSLLASLNSTKTPTATRRSLAMATSAFPPTVTPAPTAAPTAQPPMHSHCQSGLAPLVYEEAIKAGFSYGYVATNCLANGASLPSVVDVLASAKRLGRAPRMNQTSLHKIDDYFEWICSRDNFSRGEKANYDPALYEHQIPGGMISNLRAQLAVMGISHREAEILEETARVRRDLGYPILVSPFAQYIVTQAVLNVMQGERYKTIPNEVKLYLKGHYGKLAGSPSKEVMSRANVEYDSSRRPGELIEPALPMLRKKWGTSVSKDQLSLHAFYPDNLALGLRDGAKEALNQGKVLQPFSELVKYLVMKKEYSKIRTRLGGIEISFTS